MTDQALRKIAIQLVTRCERCGGPMRRKQRRFCTAQCRNWWTNENTLANLRAIAASSPRWGR